jgi:hypothetical protein
MNLRNGKWRIRIERCGMHTWIIVALSALALACNFPGWATPVSEASPTTESQTTESAATPILAPTETDVLVKPTALPATATLTVTMTPTATATLTPTATPAGPTATPTLAPPGPPLSFDDPAWELVEWHEVADANEWEGIIRAHVVGGVPPYRFQIEDKPVSDSADLVVRWRLCKAMPATIRVWSADGQQAGTVIWVWELGCKD